MSSPSVLYALDNIEQSGPRPGERVLLLSFGSSFKVHSQVLIKGEKRLYAEPKRFAVVAGGTSGIGLEAARMLIGKGYTTFVGSRRVGNGGEDGYEKLAQAIYLPLDVTSPASVAEFAEQVWQRSFGIDVLVVSAGVALPTQPHGRLEPESIAGTVQTNLTGAMLLVNQLLPKLRVQARVVLLNSLLGQIPLMGSATYCVTKAGLRHFAEALEVELKRAGRAVGVFNLYPAYVRTPMLEQVQTRDRPLLPPIPVDVVTAALARIVDGDGEAQDGFVLRRDRLIAGLYRRLPGTFKSLLARL